jgi:ABC-type transport system involved in cytochrome c biogenesis ATPase subunit
MILYKTTNLSYEIDSRTIFSNLDFEISSNAIYEIRGNNGSGKSSLLKILSGLNKMDKVYYDENLESNITYLGHKNGFVEEISLRDNFEIIGVPINDTLFKRFGLTKLKNQKFFNLSFGEKRKAALVRAITSKKKIWILDEPFAGLDKESIKNLKKVFYEHIAKGVCIIMANHQEELDESVKIHLENNV